MNGSRALWWVLGGLAATVGVGAAVGASKSSAATPPAPTPAAGGSGSATQTFPMQAGHRYGVKVSSSGPLSGSFAVANVLGSFPGSVSATPGSAQASATGVTLNVLTATGAIDAVSYSFDLMVTPSGGAMSGLQLATPLTYPQTPAVDANANLELPSGTGSVTVTVQDMGPSPASSPSVGGPSGGWTDLISGSTVSPGAGVRLSMKASDFATLAQAAGYALTAAGFAQLVSTMPQPWSTASLTTYAPGDTLPSDWPADDPDTSGEYHAQFLYTNGQPYTLPAAPSLQGVTVYGWQNAGGLSAPVTAPPTPSGSTSPQTVLIAQSQAQAASVPGKGYSLQVTGTLPGTPLTITLEPPGASFDYINLTELNPGAIQAAGFPLVSAVQLPFNPTAAGIAPSGAIYQVITPTAQGQIEIVWRDSYNRSWRTTVNYGP